MSASPEFPARPDVGSGTAQIERALLILGLVLSVPTSIPLFTQLGDFPVFVLLLMLAAFLVGVLCLLIALVMFLIRRT